MEQYPFSDDYMFYDYERHRYVLTKQSALDFLGIDLAERINAHGGDKDLQVQYILRQVSDIIYGFIYSCNSNNKLQEYICAKHPNAREKIKNAMLQQLQYMIFNGDLTKFGGVDSRRGTIADASTVRRASFDPMARDILLQEIDGKIPALAYSGYLFTLKHLPAYQEEGY